MGVTGKPWVRHYFWPIFCLSIIHKISECLKLEGASGYHLVQPLWSSRGTCSRLPRVMSRWLLKISKRDTPHPPWASCGSAWLPSQERSVSWCSKSKVVRPLTLWAQPFTSVPDFQPEKIQELFQFFLSEALYSPFTCAVSQCCRRLLCYRRCTPLSLLEGTVFLVWCCHVPVPPGWIMFCTLAVGENIARLPAVNNSCSLKHNTGT